MQKSVLKIHDFMLASVAQLVECSPVCPKVMVSPGQFVSVGWASSSSGAVKDYQLVLSHALVTGSLPARRHAGGSMSVFSSHGYFLALTFILSLPLAKINKI